MQQQTLIIENSTPDQEVNSFYDTEESESAVKFSFDDNAGTEVQANMGTVDLTASKWSDKMCLT